jgi:hypothetical protein
MSMTFEDIASAENFIGSVEAHLGPSLILGQLTGCT